MGRYDGPSDFGFGCYDYDLVETMRLAGGRQILVVVYPELPKSAIF